MKKQANSNHQQKSRNYGDDFESESSTVTSTGTLDSTTAKSIEHVTLSLDQPSNIGSNENNEDLGSEWFDMDKYENDGEYDHHNDHLDVIKHEHHYEEESDEASVEPTKLTTSKIMETTKTNSADKTPTPTLSSLSTDFEDFFTMEDKSNVVNFANTVESMVY